MSMQTSPAAASVADLRRGRLRLRGRQVSYVETGPEGAAPWVVLLHGGGIDRGDWAWGRTMRHLAPRFRCFAPDMPGYGGSDGFGRAHGIADFGPWLGAVLDARGIDRAHLVGSSMGGGTALWLALDAPARVRSVTVVGSYGLARRAPLHPALHLYSLGPAGRFIALSAARSRLAARAALMAVYADPRRVTPGLVEEMYQEAQRQAELQTFRGFLQAEVGAASFRTCFLDRLPGLVPPLFVMHGRSDRMVPLRHAREAARVAPEARLLEMDAGHWPMREQPKIFDSALDTFLTDVEAGRLRRAAPSRAPAAT
ncbi:alpha/beta fold hydrolase [Mesobaculum littorinae]|nr:alpha/beta fold hydrolase [Mesobaculum littorinae]